MHRYLSLVSFTNQGIREVKDWIERANRIRSAVETVGGNVVGLYWAVGGADGAVIFETPNEETAAQLPLSLGRDGHVRTRTTQRSLGPSWNRSNQQNQQTANFSQRPALGASYSARCAERRAHCALKCTSLPRSAKPQGRTRNGVRAF